MRQMIGGNVVDERAIYFIVADAAMQPAQKDDKLHADGNENGQELRNMR
jgi:hypothetical protein